MPGKRKQAEYETGKKAQENFEKAIDVILSGAKPTGKTQKKKKSGG